MRVHVVTPVTTTGLSQAADFAPFARPDTEVTHTVLDTGPASIESYFDEALAQPGTIAKILQAESDGADVALIDCMGDPALQASREASSMLVLGPAQTSMYVAALLAHNFSVVTTLTSAVRMFWDLAGQYGIAQKMRSVRAVHIPVLELHDEKRLDAALLDQSLGAIEEDGAHAIVFGCTGMRGHAERLRDGLSAQGHDGIPLIDPMIVTLKVAEALVDVGLTPSTRTYPAPAAKEIVGYEGFGTR